MWRPRPKQIWGSALSRKTSKLQRYTNSTANRHRCSGRVAQGERVRGLQGTRQKSGRKLAIRPAFNASRRRKNYDKVQINSGKSRIATKKRGAHASSEAEKERRSRKWFERSRDTPRDISSPRIEAFVVVQFSETAIHGWIASSLRCWRPQLKYAWRLFIKNTAPCELARGCIGGDT